MTLKLNDADPCGTAAQLRQAYADLVVGGKDQMVTFKAGANGVEKSVTYNRADPPRLLMLVREWEAKCAAASGARPRRFAVRGGGAIR
jgi:hypothetical protein